MNHTIPEILIAFVPIIVALAALIFLGRYKGPKRSRGRHAAEPSAERTKGKRVYKKSTNHSAFPDSSSGL